MKSVLEKDEAEKVAVIFTPRKFPQTISGTAKDFMRYQQDHPEAGFRIDRIVAQQTGVAELERVSIEQQVELLALEKVREMQETAYKEAYQLGLDEGRERAYEETRVVIEARLAEFHGLLKNLTELKSELLAHNEAHLIKLLVHMASRVAMTEIQTRQEVVLGVIKQAVDSAQSEENITVRVSNNDFAFINSMQDRFDKHLEALKRVKFEESDTIRSGGCIVETNFGSVDASIEKRVEKLWEAVGDKVPKVKDKIGGE